MGDYRSERVDRRRDEDFVAEQIEKDRRDKEKFKPTESDEKKILFAAFFYQLKNFFNLFSSPKKFTATVIDKQDAVDHLRQYKYLLKGLGQQNLSHSSDYAAELSDTWQKLVDDFEKLEIMEKQGLVKVSVFREMIDVMKTYPPDSEHRLGYYLLQQIGKGWLPFPFIEILEGLHKEHQQDTKQSTLTRWIHWIDQTILSLETGWGKVH